MTDSLEVDDFPELSDVLSLFVAPGLSGERSRRPGSRIVGSVRGMSSSRGLVRSLPSVSVHSDSETGEYGRLCDWTSVSIPGGSWAGPLVGENGRGRVTADTDPGDGIAITVGGFGPETTVANVRGLVGGVMDISSLWVGAGSLLDGGLGTSSLGPPSPDGAVGLLGHCFVSWPVSPHLKHDLT